jgi:hypothetical protein
MCNEITKTHQEHTGVSPGGHPKGMEKAEMEERPWELPLANPPEKDHRVKSQKPTSPPPPRDKTNGTRANPPETRPGVSNKP